MSPQAIDAVAKDAAHVVHLLKALAAEPSVERLTALAQENDRLWREVKDLEVANRGTVLNISRIQGDLELKEKELEEKKGELQGIASKKEALTQSLAAMEKSMNEMKKKMESLVADMKKKEQTARSELDEKDAELQRIADFTVEMVPFSDREEPAKLALETIYSSARRLADTWFGIEIPGITKASLHKMQDAVKSVKMNLPWSNTPVAKQIRVAAVLWIMGWELKKHVFQPTYLLTDSADFNKFLDKLAAADPEQEFFLRSALLSASDKAGRRPEVSRACAEGAANGVFATVKDFVPEGKQSQFRAELLSLCATACEQWEVIQRLEERIVAEPGSLMESRMKYKWKPLSFPSSVPSLPPPPSTKTRPNGTAAAPGSAKNPPAPLPRADPPADVTEGAAVWPAFYDMFTSQTLAEGLLLPPALIDAASEEQKGLLTTLSGPAGGPARAAREEIRKHPGRRRSATANGPNASAFLSSRLGAGQKGA